MWQWILRIFGRSGKPIRRRSRRRRRTNRRRRREHRKHIKRVPRDAPNQPPGHSNLKLQWQRHINDRQAVNDQIQRLREQMSESFNPVGEQTPAYRQAKIRLERLKRRLRILDSDIDGVKGLLGIGESVPRI